MKIIYYCCFVVIIILLISCQVDSRVKEDSETEKVTESLIENIKSDDVEIIEIEDCEYIVLKSTPSDHANHAYGFMAHKGNCKNPIHCHNKTSSSADTIK